MRRVAAETLVDAQLDRMRRRAVKLKCALAHIGFDAVERLEEIGLPGRAAVFAVGDRLEADRLLLLDQRLDLAILDRLELGGGDLFLVVPGARVLERLRTQ
jgi:hypothetical protein